MITSEQKELALEAIKEHGTLQAGAKAAGISIKTLNEEKKRSEIFKKRIIEALQEGRGRLADNARQLVIDYMMGKYSKTDRNQLTAAIALLNAYEPGFRGTTRVEGRIEHDIRVVSAVPRPRYDELPQIKVIDEDKEKLKQLNAGKPITARDKITDKITEESS